MNQLPRSPGTRMFTATAIALITLLRPCEVSAQTNTAGSATSQPKLGFVMAADYSASVGGQAVLIIVDGKPVFERYDNGWAAGRAHPLASGTKSFTGAVAGAAVEDKLITWDELACDTILQWKLDPLKSKITVRHLLSLSSGLDPADDTFQPGVKSIRRGDLAGYAKAEQAAPFDRFVAAVDLAVHHEPGTKFEYGPSHYYAFGYLLETKLKARHKADPSFPDETFTSYMYRRVIDPIGIKVGNWNKDKSGHLNLPGGASLTPQEWAKYGEFIRHEGAVAGPDGKMKPVIAWNALSECFKPSKANRMYGMTWWLPSEGKVAAKFEADSLPAGSGPTDSGSTGSGSTGSGSADSRTTLRDRIKERIKARTLDKEAEEAGDVGATGPDGKPLVIYMAAGLGKQRLYVLPQYKLTVVRFAPLANESKEFSNVKFLKPIIEELRK